MPGQAPANMTSRSVHQSIPLTNLSIGYHPTGMIAEKVFSVFKVKKENDNYYKWDKGQAFRVDRTDGYGTLRADRSRPKRRNYGATEAGYVAEEFALETGISDREYSNADSALQLELSKTRRVQDEILLDQEIRVAATCLNIANNAGSITLSGTSQWNNAGFVSQTSGQHSAIYGEFEAGKDTIRKNTGGLFPNTVVIPYSVAAIMKNDPGLEDLVKYTHPDLMEQGLLPRTLWGMRVLIPTVVYTTSVEGEPYVGNDVWGKNVWMGYINPEPGLDILTYGLILRAREWQVKSYRVEEEDSTIFRPSILQAEALIAADCGYLIQSAIA